MRVFARTEVTQGMTQCDVCLAIHEQLVSEHIKPYDIWNSCGARLSQHCLKLPNLGACQVVGRADILCAQAAVGKERQSRFCFDTTIRSIKARSYIPVLLKSHVPSGPTVIFITQDFAR